MFLNVGSTFGLFALRGQTGLRFGRGGGRLILSLVSRPWRIACDTQVGWWQCGPIHVRLRKPHNNNSMER